MQAMTVIRTGEIIEGKLGNKQRRSQGRTSYCVYWYFKILDVYISTDRMINK